MQVDERHRGRVLKALQRVGLLSPEGEDDGNAQDQGSEKP